MSHKQKFSWLKFIIDCLLCFLLMIVSSFGFIPLYYIYGFFGKVGLHLFSSFCNLCSDFYDIALELNILSLIPFVIMFVLSKFKMIQFKLYKSSFWIVFILVSAFW